ncbi:hypothetical protein [Methylobacterium sp. GC_Met_3]|uniref:hypothetical protein n=1 Tax=Methylobacterium sp. GC_Met_3 TaxID=2937375 RepID=UPI00226AE0E9|nr:hypothetical protein [Methylobacterium sp. GC_Met_3]
MGSKTPPHSMPVPGAPDEDRSGYPASSKGTRHSKLLSRIADALQVPQAALYQPPNAVTLGRGAHGDGAADLDRDCAALLHAFRRIGDLEERHRLLALVQAVAERT